MARHKDDQIDYIFKVVLVGDSGVGKTSLLSRFIRNEFERNVMLTTCKMPDFSTRTMTIQGKVVKAQIWDMFGQERFGNLRPAYYRRAVGALLVYDMTAPKSFENLGKQLEQLREHAESSVRIVLVGNKRDLDQQRTVATEEGQSLAEKENIPFFETSALDSTNVKEAFNRLIEDVFQTQVEELGTLPLTSPPAESGKPPESKMSCTCQ